MFRPVDIINANQDAAVCGGMETNMKAIFITGAPGSGKTYISDAIMRKMALAQNTITQVSSDIMRDILRANICAAQEPALHSSSLHAGEHAPPNVQDPAVWGYQKQAEIVIDNGIIPTIKRMFTEDKNIVIDGVHCIPSMLNDKLAALTHGGLEIITICCYVPDVETHLAQITSQGRSYVAEKLENIKPIRHMQEFLHADSLKAGSYIVGGASALSQIDNILSQLFEM